MLLCLAGCKEKAKTISGRSDMDALRSATVGSYIFFGEYEQDDNVSTGKEAIEWLVLNKREDMMLVISRYGLDCQPYNTENKNVTWETCTLRNWLNNTFYETAFIPEERNRILAVSTVNDAPTQDTIVGMLDISSADYSLKGHINPGYASVADKISLLSVDEVNQYFSDKDARVCLGTPYSEAQGVSLWEGQCWWWLRSLGVSSDRAPSVGNEGGVWDDDLVDYENRAVRPVMWIDLKP